MAKILLGICGGIAAYKSVLLARLLKQQGHEVRCVLTDSAASFVSKQTLQALTGEVVRQDLFDEQAEAAMSHIELARWADVLVIAPATANTIAKLALGLADNLLTTLYLASNAAVLIAPAMNQQMWAQPAIAQHVQTLSQRNRHSLMPVGIGEQACGDVGAGRMAEPEMIAQKIAQILLAQNDFQGLRVCISAGPTREAIDPVRYLSNHSSGKMGYAIAQAARNRGAEVLLISGPTALPPPLDCRLIKVESALDMYQAVMQEVREYDIFISAAAVADYRVAEIAQEKQKKSVHGALQLVLVENPDIVASVAALTEKRPFTVGFAAETDHLLEYARQKLQQKHLDLIVANNVREQGFGGDNSQLFLLSKERQITLPSASKSWLAEQLLNHILQHYQERKHASN